jgi:hypothetical protein
MANASGRITQPSPPLGVQLIAGFYFFGALVLLLASFVNTTEVSRIIAERHLLPAGLGVVVPLAVAALGVAIALGLYSLARWGLVLTVTYLLFFGGVSLALGGLDFLETGNTAQQVYFGNLLWSVLALAYLSSRRHYFRG